MSLPKSAVFSCPGLGDGIVTLILSNNLHLNGFDVTTFHDKKLSELQSWFPHLPIRSYNKDIDVLLCTYSQIYVSYDESSFFVKKLIEEGKRRANVQVRVLNPSPTRNIGSQPYYEDALFNPKISMVDNLEIFCKEILGLTRTTRSNGIIIPEELSYRKNKNRILIHPTSGKESKNWSEKGYVKLALHLKKEGFNPYFTVSPTERDTWAWVEKEGVNIPYFPNLDTLARFTYESGYMIGNDSGIGHLASALGIPTLSIFRNWRTARLWRPGWAPGFILYPNRLIPNLGGFRLRDKKWKNLISFRKVHQSFQKLLEQKLDNG